MTMTQEEANVEATLANAELSRAHARLMNAQAAQLELKHAPVRLGERSNQRPAPLGMRTDA